MNPDYAQGISTSLRRGLRSCSSKAKGAAVLLADQPGVTADLIDRMAAAFMSSSAPIVRPVFTDASCQRIPGHPVFLARPVWDAVDELFGDEGARALLAAQP